MTDESTDLGATGEEIVLFAGAPALEPGQVELQSFREKIFGRRIEDVQADWQRVSKQIAVIVDATNTERPRGFELDSIEVGLAFSASGKLAFVAEAGVEASITVSLKRKV